MSNYLNDKQKINFAISNFHELEERLMDCLSYIPFIEQNQNTISSKFIPIILEACSLIESIFKDTLGKGKFNFKNYSREIDSQLNLSETITIFLTTPLKFIQPYSNWKDEVPLWWDVYNKIKHDRLTNMHLATFNNAVLAITALHQIISKHRKYTNHIIEQGWISPDSEIIGELVGARLINDNCIPINLIACESKLFVSPLGANFVEKRKKQFFVVDNCEFSNRVRVKINMSEFELI
ncbi:MAG: hypothetical protein ACOCWM_03515 [Cyclobacteriaceae bacterium]